MDGVWYKVCSCFVGLLYSLCVFFRLNISFLMKGSPACGWLVWVPFLQSFFSGFDYVFFQLKISGFIARVCVLTVESYLSSFDDLRKWVRFGVDIQPCVVCAPFSGALCVWYGCGDSRNFFWVSECLVCPFPCSPSGLTS